MLRDDDNKNRRGVYKGINVSLVSDRFGTEPLDITGSVSAFRLNLQLTRGWETLEVTLVSDQPQDRRIPEPGDWIVFRSGYAKGKEDPTVAALFFGYVTSSKQQANAGSDGSIASQSIDVSAISWMELLSNAAVYFAPAAKQSIGTFFAKKGVRSDLKLGGVLEKLRGWEELIEAILAEATQGGSSVIGKSLARVWNVLAAVVLPLAINAEVRTDATIDEEPEVRVGSEIGDMVPVVYDDSTRRKYAPRLTVEPIPGRSLEGFKSYHPMGQSALDIIMGTFFADVNLMELYPTLEPFDSAAPGRPDTVETTIEAFHAERARQRRDETPIDDLPDDERNERKHERALEYLIDQSTPPSLATHASALGRFLGVNPVVVYRMKPWRMENLGAYQQRKGTPARPIQTGRSEVADLAPINSTLFGGRTWSVRDSDGKIVHGFAYSADEVTNWQGSKDDKDHVNSVALGLPNQMDHDIRWLEAAGLPLMARDAIYESGLRHFQPNWPFWPEASEDANSDDIAVFTKKNADLLTDIYTIALQAMQFMGAADRFYKGSVQFADMRPELRPGMTLDVEVPQFSRDYFMCYAESVTHTGTVNAESGEVTARTQVSYGRGAFVPAIYTDQFIPPRRGAGDGVEEPRSGTTERSLQYDRAKKEWFDI